MMLNTQSELVDVEALWEEECTAQTGTSADLSWFLLLENGQQAHPYMDPFPGLGACVVTCLSLRIWCSWAA